MTKKKMDEVLSGKNQAFCMAPWTHTYLSPQSERRLCCASREQASFVEQYIDNKDFSSTKSDSYSPQSLEEHWNSEHLRRIRKQMLDGVRPEECVVCETKELNLETYQDYFNQDLYPDLIGTAILSTNEDGHTSMKPRSFDYRISNECNFKCRMCGDQLSSSWEIETKKYRNQNPQPNEWTNEVLNKKIKTFQKNVAQVEFFNALKNGEVDEIYWVGGEPLIWDFHWEIMNEAIQTGFAKNIFCRYNSNLSVINHKGRNLFRDILPEFKGYLIGASIDAPGTIGEYIRTGLKWDRWLGNVEEIKSLTNPKRNQHIYLDLTLTLPGMFGLKEMIKIANKLNIEIQPKLVYAFDSSITISPLALPRKILNQFIDEIMRDMFRDLNPNTIPLFKFLRNLRSRKTHQEQYPDNYLEGFKKGREYQLSLEKIRKSNVTLDKIYSAREDVLEWWRSDSY